MTLFVFTFNQSDYEHQQVVVNAANAEQALGLLCADLSRHAGRRVDGAGRAYDVEHLDPVPVAVTGPVAYTWGVSG